MPEFRREDSCSTEGTGNRLLQSQPPQEAHRQYRVYPMRRTAIAGRTVFLHCIARDCGAGRGEDRAKARSNNGVQHQMSPNSCAPQSFWQYKLPARSRAAAWVAALFLARSSNDSLFRFQKREIRLTCTARMEYTFKLDDAFVEKYKSIPPPFGFNGLGETIYRRTYSRVINGKRERWYQTVRRVVEGTYSIQMNHINMNQLGWNAEQGQRSAQEMYDLIFRMKFLPPGRGLYCMGTDIVGFAARLSQTGSPEESGRGAEQLRLRVDGGHRQGPHAALRVSDGRDDARSGRGLRLQGRRQADDPSGNQSVA